MLKVRTFYLPGKLPAVYITTVCVDSQAIVKSAMSKMHDIISSQKQ